jgi:hypothetical protein
MERSPAEVAREKAIVPPSKPAEKVIEHRRKVIKYN